MLELVLPNCRCNHHDCAQHLLLTQFVLCVNLQALLTLLHTTGNHHHGVSADGIACNMLELGVIEPLHVKRTMLMNATQMATTLIKVHGDVVRI